MPVTSQRSRLCAWAIGLSLITTEAVVAGSNTAPTVRPPSTELVQRLDLDDGFYRKWLDADGLPILASDNVSDYALLEAQWIIDRMLAGREDLRRAIISKDIRVVIMSPTELTTDVPEHSDLTPAAYWNKRARGLGATDRRPAVSSGEENLLEYSGDPYREENILVHEFAHVIHQHGLAVLDPDFDKRLRELFDQARSEGLWKSKYAGTNRNEYFAEAVQSWFGTNRENDFEHNHVNTREELKQYDPRMGALLASIFGDNDWTYLAPSKRTSGLDHLKGFDQATAPTFHWPREVRRAYEAHKNRLPKLENKLAEDWSAVRSTPATNEVALTFRNRTSETLIIYWVDFDGRLKPYGEVDPGREKHQSTFEGHRWQLESESAKPLGRFVATAVDSAAEVHSSKHNKADQNGLLELQNKLADNWSGVRSDRSANRVNVTFHNQTTERLKVYWIDFEGQRKPYGAIDPGHKKRQGTFEGHRWELESGSGQLLGRFIASDADSTAKVASIE